MTREQETGFPQDETGFPGFVVTAKESAWIRRKMA